MIKPKRTIRSGSHVILNDRVVSSDNDILEMWASHFENLTKPSAEPHYDEGFKEYIDGDVKYIFQKCLNSSSCIEDIFGFEKVKKCALISTVIMKKQEVLITLSMNILNLVGNNFGRYYLTYLCPYIQFTMFHHP